MSTERPPVDHLAEAKTAAGQVNTNQAVMYALVSIAESLREITQQLATNNAETYAAGVLNGAAVGSTATAEAFAAISTVLGGQTAATADADAPQSEPCIICGADEVTETEWGWECRTCGSSDVAQGCVKP